MKKSLLLIVAVFLMLPFANASHIVGGETTVKWVGPTQNDFQIQVRVFRSCQSGSAGMPASVSVDIRDLVTYNAIQSVTITNPVITANLPFSDPCTQVVGICVDEGLFTQNVTIPNNPSGNGYFLEYQICCRNNGVLNLANPSGDGMTFYCEIPDPALGLNNSNPDMGAYPLNAFFCVNNPKTFQFNVIDADGDSLVYSLVTPLDDGAMNAAPAFPYNNVNYAGGYNLGNMIGGASPFVINQNTGFMTGAPSIGGQFVFGVKVEEYRSGVKIGEVRRDAQFEAISSCQSGNPLTYADLSISNGVTLPIPYNKLYCKDFVYTDPNGDTLYMEIISPIFDSGAYLATMVPDLNGDFTYYYDFNGTSFNDSVTIPPNVFDPVFGGDFNIGYIGQRLCFTPPCSQIGEIYPITIAGASLGCDGFSGDTIDFFIEVIPPVFDFKNPGDKEVLVNSEYCRNLVFHDTSIFDMLDITIYSDIFGLPEPATIPSLGTNYSYNNFIYPTPYPGNSFSTGVGNGVNNPSVVATRLCWTPTCEEYNKVYNVKAILLSADCPNVIPDTIEFNYIVTPPFDSLDVVPNVITPNCDGINDVFTFGLDKLDANGNPVLDANGEQIRIGGTSNVCFDNLDVQIFNRWGLLVFESDQNPTFAWDGSNKGGSKVAAGTYFVLVSGTYGNEVVKLAQRTVTVIDPQNCN